jgi:hypothetical protein
VDPAQASLVLLFEEAVEGPVPVGSVFLDSSGYRNDAVLVDRGGSSNDEQGAAPAPAITALTQHGTLGRSLAWPPPCVERRCYRPILEVPDDPSLDPQDRPLQFGARVRMNPDQTSAGENIIQKGFSRGGQSQWKLQVDGADGTPSCVLVGLGDDEIHRVESEVPVADGEWHDVICRREGARWSINVDGQEVVIPVPAGLVIETDAPVRIGGKNTKPDNDSFLGELDRVWVTTG